MSCAEASRESSLKLPTARCRTAAGPERRGTANLLPRRQDTHTGVRDPQQTIRGRSSSCRVMMANGSVDVNQPHSMGTTIIGVTYNGGVVLAADSRTSTGMYVANRASDKITQLTDNVYVCRSGSAADSQIVSDYVRYFLHQHTIQLGQPATVKVAANLARLLSYNNKDMLQTGLIVGGWDKYEGGKIYGIPLGGAVLEQPFAIGGSGSTYLYGFFDQAWKEGMTQEEAE